MANKLMCVLTLRVPVRNDSLGESAWTCAQALPAGLPKLRSASPVGRGWSSEHHTPDATPEGWEGQGRGTGAKRSSLEKPGLERPHLLSGHFPAGAESPWCRGKVSGTGHLLQSSLSTCPVWAPVSFQWKCLRGLLCSDGNCSASLHSLNLGATASGRLFLQQGHIGSP